MTETIPLSEVPDDIGRNDPCPCGSGKKYKKCCMRAHRVQKEASKASRKPHEMVGADTSPWDMFKLLVQVRENNMPNFLWELSHEDGPWRQEYPSKEEYFEAIGAGDDHLLARDGFDLTRIRHDGPDVLLMIGRGHDNPQLSSLDIEVVRFRRNELGIERSTRATPHPGWRIWEVKRHEVKKSDVDGDVTFAELGYEWSPPLS